MARFVFASRRTQHGGNAMDAERWLNRSAARSDVLARTVIGANRARFIAVVDLDPTTAHALPVPASMVLEPEVRHEIASPGFALRLRGTTTPLAAALVMARFRRGDEQRELFEEANAEGVAHFDVNPAEWTLDTVVVKPRHSYWTRVAIELEPGNALTCEPLPVGPLGWWHEAVGLQSYDESRGRGIRIGVVDTGCGPNRCLDHVENAGSYSNLSHDAEGGRDTDGHGTHVCGLIAARSVESHHFCGIAPGADLVTARVCDTSATTNQADLAMALDALDAEYRVDLVNMSLAAKLRSEVLQDAVLDLRDSGVLCFCAAGNAAESVWFPAALDATIAVSAIGMAGWAPRFSISSGQRPADEDQDRIVANFFLARFSCSGPEIGCAGPGVGILSTVPTVSGEPAFAEMDGTSMASPIACATLAVRLAADPAYGEQGRAAARADYAHRVLAASCTDLGLAAEFQGHGLPRV